MNAGSLEIRNNSRIFQSSIVCEVSLIKPPSELNPSQHPAHSCIPHTWHRPDTHLAHGRCSLKDKMREGRKKEVSLGPPHRLHFLEYILLKTSVKNPKSAVPIHDPTQVFRIT